MLITIPAKFKSYLYTQIHFGGCIRLSRSDTDTKYIYITAMYDRNRLKSFKKFIESYKEEIQLEVSSKLISSGFKGVGEVAIVDINQHLSNRFDEFFFKYMNNFGFDHSKRYPGYDIGIESFFQRFDIDEAFLSRENMNKLYYRYRKNLTDYKEFNFVSQRLNSALMSSQNS